MAGPFLRRQLEGWRRGLLWLIQQRGRLSYVARRDALVHVGLGHPRAHGGDDASELDQVRQVCGHPAGADRAGYLDVTKL